MLRHLLVPLDGSALAAAALPYAISLARGEQARISLLAVVPAFPERTGLPSDDASEANERQVAESTAYLDTIAATLHTDGIAVTTVVRHGNAANAILAYAEEAACSLVVMSTHGRTGLNRLRAGSVAQHVLRHAAIPTLVVRAGVVSATGAMAEITEITATLDGSDLAEIALPLATHLAVALAVPLTLLQVIPNLAALAYGGWGGGYSNYFPATVELEADDNRAVNDYLTAVAARLAQPGLEVRTHAERSMTTRAEETVTTYLAERPQGLAVIASHGRGGVLRWVLGSTAEGILDQAVCPILIVRAGVAPLTTSAGAPDAAV